MFSYAARTILSKTLRHFLQKYLVDVNIDELALGGDSGWGITLKNVEFREGAILFSFPVNFPVSNTNKSHDDNGNSGSNDVNESNCEGIERGGGGGNTSSSSSSSNETTSNSQDEDETLTVIPTSDEKEANTANDPTKTENNENATELDALIKEHKVDHTQPISASRDSSKKSSKVPFFCYSSSKNHDEDSEHDAMSIKSDHDSIFTDDNTNKIVHEHDMNSAVNPNEMEKDEKEDDENERIIEFRVGKGGVIGNLGIRLVGSDRHISVTDAFFILEVVSKPSKNNASKNTKSKQKHSKKAESAGENVDNSSTKNSNNSDSTTGGNQLARMIASLPHILFSNIIVKVVFIDHEQNFDKNNNHDNNLDSHDGVIDHSQSFKAEVLRNQNQIIEIGIGSFTIMDVVTDGKTNFNYESDVESYQSDGEGSSNAQKTSSICATTTIAALKKKKSDTSDKFIQKQIKLDLGNQKGFWINIFPPARHPMCRVNEPVDPSWARCAWESYTRPFFHLSGVDFTARIHAGLLEVDSQIKETQPVYDSEYDAFTLDSTIGGYIDFTPEMLSTKSSDEDEKSTESLNVEPGKCDFHRIAKGMRRYPLPHSSPHSDDSSCWVEGASSQKPDTTGNAKDLNNVIPSPGVAIFLSISDQIELNIERQSIEAITTLTNIVSLYSANNSNPDSSTTNDNEKKTTAAKKESENDESDDDSNETINDLFFPSYMNAQNVLALGFQINRIAVRIQLMKDNVFHENGYGFGFCELILHSISMDCQLLTASVLSISDYVFDIGHIELSVLKGVCRTQHIDMGKAISTDEVRHTVPTLLKSTSLLKSSEFNNKQMGAFQMRIIFCNADKETSSNLVINEHKTFEIKLGQLYVNLTSNLIEDLSSTSNIMRSILIPEPSESKSSSPTPFPKQFTWKYYLTLDGGTLVYGNMKCEFPSSQVIGEKSPSIGFLIESVLNQVQLKISYELTGCANGKGFLRDVVNLPENVRMRVFLFLDDLKPLSTALGIKNTPKNTFLGCYTINKYLSSISRYISLESIRSKVDTKKKENRRQVLVSKLLDLDDKALEEVLSMHEEKVLRQAQLN